VKEELGWLKLIFGALMATDVSLIAWVGQNFDSQDRIRIGAAIIAVAVVTAGVAWINRLAYRLIRRLERR